MASRDAVSVRRISAHVSDAYVVARTNREVLRIGGHAGRRPLLCPIHVHCAARVVYPVNQRACHVINVLYKY